MVENLKKSQPLSEAKDPLSFTAKQASLRMRIPSSRQPGPIRNPNLHLEPTLFAVGCAKLPTMQPDSAIGNGQPKSRPPGQPVAGIVEPVKRLEDFWQRLFGNSGAGIKHANHNFRSRIR